MAKAKDKGRTRRTDKEVRKRVSREVARMARETNKEMEREVEQGVKMQIKLYHCATQQDAEDYQLSGGIKSPKGFDTLQAAMYWCMKYGDDSKVIYEMRINTNVSDVSILLDIYHNDFGRAYQCHGYVSIKDIKCVMSI